MIEKTCSTCKFWKPVYYQVGNCQAEGTSHSKFWVTPPKDAGLLTHFSFSCQAWQPIPADEVTKDIL